MTVAGGTGVATGVSVGGISVGGDGVALSTGIMAIATLIDVGSGDDVAVGNSISLCVGEGSGCDSVAQAANVRPVKAATNSMTVRRRSSEKRSRRSFESDESNEPCPQISYCSCFVST